MKLSSNNETQEANKVTPVYIQDGESCWIPALQLKTFGSSKAVVAVPKFKNEAEMMHCAKASKTFKYHDNQVVDMADYPNKVLPMQNVDDNGNLEDYKDMVDLPFMHEAGILYNLKLRHKREKPYTRTGDIVIAVNPYQWLHELYSEEKRTYYSNRLVWEQSEEDPRAVMEPHVYEVSALAYKGLAMDEEGLNQSILVSGESGAGKTETVKICLNHIASVQRGQVPPGYFEATEHDPIVKRVVESNPLLEAFGNAQTRRNDNSSRFGKYLQLQFQKNIKSEYAVLKSARTGLVGSKCDVYLLEKNRVVGHETGERNFHIFYQLLAASDEQKTQFWEGLRGAGNESFKYVGSTKTDTIEGKHDRIRFQETLDALALVGVSGEKLNTLMQALCIVLQLGNLGFKSLDGDSDRSAVATKKELKALSELMGISTGALASSFTERTFKTRTESYKVQLNADSAKEACDALAKEAYQKAFLWIVNNINKSTSADESNGKTYGTIGLLDIFGFEYFNYNGFEQLCINYANEKLQQKFNQDIFKNVQAEYKAEGISLEDIRFDDNTDVLDLIEGRTGLLNLLNEECVRPKGNDIDFVSKALRINKDSPCLLVNKTDRLSFAIQHYAAKVMYDAESFVTKNLDTLPTDLQLCAESCTNSIINTPRLDANVGAKKNTGKKWGRVPSNITAPTVWTKYKSQLSALMGSLRETKSRYIRCIKPNSMKQPHLMEHTSTVDQLRCAGVVAGITITRATYPNRLPNSVVLARYSHLWDKDLYPSKKTNTMTLTEKRRCDCQALMDCALKSKETVDEKGNVVKAFAVGKTKTFFRAGALEFLELGRVNGPEYKAVVVLQRFARGWLARNGGRHNKQLREMEEAMREAKRRAEEEERARLTKERAERRNARMQQLKGLENQMDTLERMCDDFVAKQDGKVRELQSQNAQARSEYDDMKTRFEHEHKSLLNQQRVEKVEHERRVDEATKLVSFLMRENRKERKKLEKVRVEHDKFKNVNGKIADDNNDLQNEIDSNGKIGAKSKGMHKSLHDQVREAKACHSSTKDKVSKHQQMYMEQAQARLQLQRLLADVLSIVQEKSKDRDLIEETCVKALQAESFSKSVMAGLDMYGMEPDLTCSDVSDSESGYY